MWDKVTELCPGLGDRLWTVESWIPPSPVAQAELGEGGLTQISTWQDTVYEFCEMLNADRCTRIAIGMLTFTGGSALCYRGIQGMWGTAGTLCVSQRAQSICSLMSGCSWLQNGQVGGQRCPHSMASRGWIHPSQQNGIFAGSFNHDETQQQILHWLRPWSNSDTRTCPACVLSQLLLTCT